MSSLSRTMTVTAAPEAVSAYLCDLTTSAEWDDHTAACRALDDGPVRIGARYLQQRRFGSWEVELEVEVVEYEPTRRVGWRSRTRFGGGSESFAFTARDDGGTSIEHVVDVELTGPARLGQRLVPDIMRRIADDGEAGLRERLERLA